MCRGSPPVNFRNHFYRRLLALPERKLEFFPEGALPDRDREAAVLLPFWPAEGESGVNVVFTHRTEHLPSHPGQVSFPGGGRNRNDATLRDTALRETAEELGIDPRSVRVMGRLDDACSIGGRRVVPYVGWLEEAPRFSPDPEEVQSVLIADVETLMRPDSAFEHQVELEGRVARTHGFRWDGGYVWGLTAEILLELQLWVEGKPSNRALLRLERLRSLGR
jgi:8-oxo-dGTP pyrophosphatase MutT (NUDIX family)